jgi:recombinational DNA repair protein RecR
MYNMSEDRSSHDLILHVMGRTESNLGSLSVEKSQPCRYCRQMRPLVQCRVCQNSRRVLSLS